METVVDLEELQRHLDALHPGVPLDNLDSEMHIRFMVIVKKIFNTRGMLDAIQVYVEEDR